MKSDSNKLLNGNLIKIKHHKTQKYLKGTIHQYIEKKFLIKRETDDLYLGTTSDQDDFYTLFVIEKRISFSEQLQYGDVIKIQDYCTQQFVSLDPSKKSDITQQCRAFISQKEHFFVIQPQFNVQDIEQIKKLDISQGELVRFYSTDNGYCLHSHQICYKNEEVDNYNEVTGYQGIDDNDFWELIYVDSSKVKNFYYQPQFQNSYFIIPGDTIIIRNFWTGWTLHSHSNKYQSTKKQEVSLFSYPRDENDEWRIFKQSSQSQLQQQFLKYDEVLLQHKKTNGFLSCNDKKCYSNFGLQVYASNEGAKNCFTFESLDGEPLKVNSPFIIKFNSTNTYLTQTGNKTESKIGIQQEAAFMQGFSYKSVWIIEQKKK